MLLRLGFLSTGTFGTGILVIPPLLRLVVSASNTNPEAIETLPGWSWLIDSVCIMHHVVAASSPEAVETLPG